MISEIQETFDPKTQRFFRSPCSTCDTQCTGHIYRTVVRDESAKNVRILLETLLARYGSFRRLCAAYWHGELTPAEERIIEERHAAAELASYKPVEGRES